MENDKVTILWDSQITTDRHVPCNKPDIIIQEKESDRCIIIVVLILSDYKIQKKTTEKMSKYVALQIECQKMWDKKVEVIPIIIGTTGVVERNITTYLQRIPGQHNIYNIQSSAIPDGPGDAVCLPVHNGKAVHIDGMSCGLAMMVNGGWGSEVSFSLSIKVLPDSPIYSCTWST